MPTQGVYQPRLRLSPRIKQLKKQQRETSLAELADLADKFKDVNEIVKSLRDDIVKKAEEIKGSSLRELFSREAFSVRRIITMIFCRKFTSLLMSVCPLRKKGMPQKRRVLEINSRFAGLYGWKSARRRMYG
jgi:hypothetical protein